MLKRVFKVFHRSLSIISDVFFIPLKKLATVVYDVHVRTLSSFCCIPRGMNVYRNLIVP